MQFKTNYALTMVALNRLECHPETGILKRRCLLIFGFLLQLVFLSNSHAATGTEITIDHAARTLVAPESESYQWYYNNQRLEGSTDKTVKVGKSGLYTVELMAGNGRTTRQSALIVVKGNAIKKIYLIGDSTVMTYSSSAYPQAGWGQTLPYFFNSSQVQLINKAIGGRSSKSFYVEGRWTPIRDGLQAGDFVFIQFGHNDRDFSKPERYADTATYKSYLRLYVNETRAKGAFPVLVTPMILNAWRNGALRNVFTEGANDYRGAMVQVATQLKVPLIDLNMKSYNLLQPLGIDYMTRFVYLGLVAGEYPNYPNGISDYTHFQEMGAIEMAKLIVEGIRGLSADANVSTLIPSLLPTYEVPVYSSNAAAGRITRTNTYPGGLTITLKAVPKSGYKLSRWIDGVGTTVTSSPTFSFVMGTARVGYKAMFTNATRLVTEEETNATSVVVSPNPSGSVFGIKAQGDFTYTLTAPSGNVLSTGKAANEVSVGEHLPAGLYLIRVEQAGKTKTLKALKE